MRIAIDIREALAESPTGKGMWTKHVLNELEKRDVEIITFPKSDPTTYPTSPRLRGAGKLIPKKLIWHWKTHLKIRSLKPDIYLSPTSYIVPWLLGKSVPTAVVIHDLIAFDREPHDKKAQLIERLTLPRVLKTAKWIFTVSEATKNDLLKRFPKTDPGKVTIVHAGPTLSKESKSASTSSTFPHVTFAKVVNNERKQSSNHDERTSNVGQTEDVRDIHDNSSRKCNGTTLKTCPYILSIGTLCPRKNQLRLIQAFNKLPDEIRKSHKLILAGGRGWDDEVIVKLAEESENVEWVGYVPDEELAELLKNAKLLAYPSLKEGFGFPVLDAMVMGIPVLTSDRSSMREIVGDAASLVDPESEGMIAEAMERLLSKESERKKLAEKGLERAKIYTWIGVVDKMLEFWNLPRYVF